MPGLWPFGQPERLRAGARGRSAPCPQLWSSRPTTTRDRTGYIEVLDLAPVTATKPTAVPSSRVADTTAALRGSMPHNYISNIRVPREQAGPGDRGPAFGKRLCARQSRRGDASPQFVPIVMPRQPSSAATPKLASTANRRHPAGDEHLCRPEQCRLAKVRWSRSAVGECWLGVPRVRRRPLNQMYVQLP